MSKSDVESNAKRCVAVVVALGIGLVIGLIGGVVLIGFGDPLLAAQRAFGTRLAVMSRQHMPCTETRVWAGGKEGTSVGQRRLSSGCQRVVCGDHLNTTQAA